MPSLNFIPLVVNAAQQPIDITHFIGDRSGLSADIAHFIMNIVDWILGVFGLDNNTTIVTFLYAAVVLGTSSVRFLALLWAK